MAEVDLTPFHNLTELIPAEVDPVVAAANAQRRLAASTPAASSVLRDPNADLPQAPPPGLPPSVDETVLRPALGVNSVKDVASLSAGRGLADQGAPQVRDPHARSAIDVARPVIVNEPRGGQTVPTTPVPAPPNEAWRSDQPWGDMGAPAHTGVIKQ